MATFAFSGAVDAVAAIGQTEQVRFFGTWADGDTWSVAFTSTLSGDFTVGKGNIAGNLFTSGFKLRDRMYVGFGSNFALSEVGDVTEWEEQGTGSAVVSFVSQYGPQDSVTAFASFEGKLVVFGKLSTQIWQINADPSQFALLQTLDQTGTTAPLSVRSIGDLDVLYLDYSGVRSIKSKEFNGNAYVSDVGTAIDLLVRESKRTFDIAHLSDGLKPCAIVEPVTKQYWLNLDVIYVLSMYPESKIIAWSTYQPTFELEGGEQSSINTTYSAGGSATRVLVPGKWYVWTAGVNGTGFTHNLITYTSAQSPVTFQAGASPIMTCDGTALQTVTCSVICTNTGFVPEKMVVYDGKVWIRSTAGRVFRYSGEFGATYDRTVATVELPWLDMGHSSKTKNAMGLDVAMKGEWAVSLGMNPRGSQLEVLNRGSESSPAVVDDSTFDIGHFNASGHGTHFKIKAVSGVNATAAKLCKFSFQYKSSNQK